MFCTTKKPANVRVDRAFDDRRRDTNTPDGSFIRTRASKDLGGGKAGIARAPRVNSPRVGEAEYSHGEGLVLRELIEGAFSCNKGSRQ
jgi:hypothetical protein